jgi:hypothetical protein
MRLAHQFALSSKVVVIWLYEPARNPHGIPIYLISKMFQELNFRSFTLQILESCAIWWHHQKTM